MQVLLNYNYVLIIAVDRMGSVPYVCHVFVVRDVKMGKSFCGCSSITTPTRVALLIYSLVRAPPCGHVGDIHRKQVQNSSDQDVFDCVSVDVVHQTLDSGVVYIKHLFFNYYYFL